MWYLFNITSQLWTVSTLVYQCSSNCCLIFCAIFSRYKGFCFSPELGGVVSPGWTVNLGSLRQIKLGFAPSLGKWKGTQYYWITGCFNLFVCNWFLIPQKKVINILLKVFIRSAYLHILGCLNACHTIYLIISLEF